MTVQPDRPIETARSGLRSLSTHLLGLHTLIMYGVAYYAIGSAAPHMARDFGISTSTIFAVLGAALVVHAMLAPRAGQLVDRHGAGVFLLVGTIGRCLALIALSLATNTGVFFAALAVIQFMSIFTEYDTAFAAAVQTHGDDARSSLSLITVWGGLASTAFWPLTAHLLDVIGWRTMFLTYAIGMAAVALPISSYVMLLGRRRDARNSAAPEPDDKELPDTPTYPGATTDVFVPLVIAFSLATVAMSLPVILPNLLDGLGLGSMAVVAGVLFGPSQTAGRFFEFVFGRRYSALSVAIVATAMLPIAIIVLLAAGPSWPGAVLFAILFGAGNGIAYVVRGTVVLALFGPSSYATILGRIARVRLIVAAATPFVITLILERFGAASALGVAALTGCLATVAFVVVARRTRSSAGVSLS